MRGLIVGACFSEFAATPIIELGQARMTASGAKRSFRDRCLNRTISNLAREVFYLCTLLPNSALRARPNVRYEEQPGKHMLALSSSQFDPKPSLRFITRSLT
jgi:hypothetical protein